MGEGGGVDPRRLLPALTALACACVVATLVVTLARPGDRPAREAPPTGAAAAASTTEAPATGPAQVLAAWDDRRAAAWAAGDAGALRSLYAVGSRAGAADVRLLEDYLGRGLTVEGLRTQVLALDVVERSSRRLVLRVTDRLVGGRAVGGTSPVALPVDRASTRTVVLVQQRSAPGDGWLVAEVRDQASPAASTSRTSSSSKS